MITPVQRRTFDQQGKITNSHGDYPEAVRQVAREERVALVDLHEMSTRFYEALGPEKSKLEDADIAFYEAEYERLRTQLQLAHDVSHLPELPGEETRAALNDLLVRVRTRGSKA